MPQFTTALLTLPESIQKLVRFIVQTKNIKRVVLFGSRARRNARENSDYDLAFWVVSRDKWTETLAEVDEKPFPYCRLTWLFLTSSQWIIKEILRRKGSFYMTQQRTENFHKTLMQLKSYLSKPIEDDRDRAGIIQAFKFTFEQSWKSIQKIVGLSGSVVGNPKQAYSTAIQSGWIDRGEEAFWIKLIEDRNLTSHTYRQDLAKEVLERIQGKYVIMFEGLLANLTKLK